MAEPRVVMVHYQVTEENTIAFVGREDLAAPHVQRIPLPQAALRDLVGSTFGTMPVRAFRSQSPASWADPLRPLVDFLEDWSAPEDIIWFVPHDVLHHVPLHALEVDGECLIERNAAAYTPSASVLKYARRMRRPGRTRALVLADARADRPLVHGREQAARVNEMYAPDAELAVGPAASVDRLARGAADAPAGLAVLHIACHGEFNRADAEHSGLWLAPTETHDGLLRAADLAAMALPTNLVMLSACESGLTGRLPGNELLGLTRALLYAGASSAVVTLWSVDELSTSVLTAAFYGRLAAGYGVAAALREAQRALRRTTLADLLDYCTTGRAGPDHTGTLLDLDVAAIHLAAGDPAAALAGYQRVAAAQPTGSPWYAAAVRGSAAARLAASGPHRTPDYSARPYRHPYFWAPFYLMGDWR
ncbi:CHAT domain-containing protein [Micromonospora sp. CPCC 205371]|nr:CHAT domain-containing protein [Micromonospora sp. CPCC 205371]